MRIPALKRVQQCRGGSRTGRCWFARHTWPPIRLVSPDALNLRPCWTRCCGNRNPSVRVCGKIIYAENASQHRAPRRRVHRRAGNARSPCSLLLCDHARLISSYDCQPGATMLRWSGELRPPDQRKQLQLTLMPGPVPRPGARWLLVPVAHPHRSRSLAAGPHLRRHDHAVAPPRRRGLRSGRW